MAIGFTVQKPRDYVGEIYPAWRDAWNIIITIKKY